MDSVLIALGQYGWFDLVWPHCLRLLALGNDQDLVLDKGRNPVPPGPARTSPQDPTAVGREPAARRRGAYLMKKLSEKQQHHLQALAAGERGAYPGLNMGTLAALERKGLARAKYGLGSMFSPHTAIKWSLTKEGQKLLNEMTGRV